MVHHVAAQGFSVAVDWYARSRPGYAPAVLEDLQRELPEGVVVELGPGTGIVTAELIASGHTVVAVEPVAAMRGALAEAVPDAEIRDGRAEAIPLATGEAGAVLAAQAFHWFDAGPALDEITRVLAPEGRLVLLWNVRDESVPWVAAFGDVMRPHRNDTPSHRTMQWRRAIDDDPRFELVFERAVEHRWPTDAEGVVARALSVSFIAALDDDDRQAVASQVRELVAPLGDSFEFPYSSRIHVWRSRP